MPSWKSAPRADNCRHQTRASCSKRETANFTRSVWLVRPTISPYYSTVKIHVASSVGFPANFGGRSIFTFAAANVGLVGTGAVDYALVSYSTCRDNSVIYYVYAMIQRYICSTVAPAAELSSAILCGTLTSRYGLRRSLRLSHGYDTHGGEPKPNKSPKPIASRHTGVGKRA